MKTILLILAIGLSSAYGMRTTPVPVIESTLVSVGDMEELITEMDAVEQQEQQERKWKMLERVLMDIVDEMKIKTEK